AQGVYFNPMKGSFDLFSSFAHGKFCKTGADSRNVLFDGAYPCKVESGMQIVNGVPQNQGQLQASVFEVWDFVYQVLKASLSIQLDCSSLCVFQSENSVLQLRDVFVGPINLQPGISEKCSHTKEVS